MTDRRAEERAAAWHDGAPDPLWSRAELAISARFVRLGLVIEVRSSTQRLLDLALEAFGDAGSTASTRNRPVDLALYLIAGPPPGGDGWPVEADESSGSSGSSGDIVSAARPIFREYMGRFAAFDGAGSSVTADLHAGVAVAWIRAGAAADRVRTLIIESNLWRLATHRGLLALHGAAVVVDGVAVVVRGAAGAGKSSVALAADVGGWAVLAEEVVWIDPVRWAIWPIARRIHFDDAAALRLAGGAAAARGADSERDATATGRGAKIAVALATDVPLDAAPIGPLILLESAPGPAAPVSVTWQAVDPAEARARCEAERIVGEHAQPAARWDAVVGRLCEGGAYVDRGGDPAARVAALSEIVRDWRRTRRQTRRRSEPAAGEDDGRSQHGSDPDSAPQAERPS